jgi:hypothetical protein
MDNKPIRTEMIQSYIAQLRTSLGEVQPVGEDRLRELFGKQDYTGMVKLIRDHMRLDLRVRVGLVNEGGPEGAPAWVSAPKPMPRFGTAEFQRTLVTVYLRKSFVRSHYFEEVAIAIAHELSHIVLFGIGHSLQECEEAVDLTAMLLGYRDLYVAGSYTKIYQSTFWQRLVEGVERHTYRTVGYLTPEEVRYAAVILGKPLDSFRASPAEPRESALFAPAKFAFSIAALAGVIWVAASPSSPTKTANIIPGPIITPSRASSVEEIPPIGTGLMLSPNQIRYCVAEDIRIDGARSALNQERSYEVNRLNGMITDYNSRCANFRYRSGTLQSVRSEIEASRNILWAAGVSRFQ